MSGFTGSTQTVEQVPGDIAGLRSGFASWLQNQGFQGLQTGAPDITPYQKMFEQQNAFNLAQAKEASGNLTGSGFANTLGKTVGRSNVEQGAFLANLLEESKQANASRLASILSPFLNTGVGPPQQQYQPGFLDYLFEGAQTAASFVPGGGGAPTPANQRGNRTQSQ
jgi:hypothetical protein